MALLLLGSGRYGPWPRLFSLHHILKDPQFPTASVLRLYLDKFSVWISVEYDHSHSFDVLVACPPEYFHVELACELFPCPFLSCLVHRNRISERVTPRRSTVLAVSRINDWAGAAREPFCQLPRIVGRSTRRRATKHDECSKRNEHGNAAHFRRPTRLLPIYHGRPESHKIHLSATPLRNRSRSCCRRRSCQLRQSRWRCDAWLDQDREEGTSIAPEWFEGRPTEKASCLILRIMILLA